MGVNVVDGGVDGDEVMERKGRKEGGERRREGGRKREMKAKREWVKGRVSAQWSKYKDSVSVSSSQECRQCADS